MDNKNEALKSAIKQIEKQFEEAQLCALEKKQIEH